MSNKKNLIKEQHPNGGAKNFLYKGHPNYKIEDAIEDYTSPHGWIRRILVHEKEVKRTLLNLSVKLPWNISLEFMHKQTDITTTPSGPPFKISFDNPFPELKPDWTSKKVSDKYKSKDLKFHSTFYFILKDHSQIFKCLDEYGEIQNLIDNQYYQYNTFSEQYQLPHWNHEVIVVISYDSGIESRIETSHPEFYFDLNDFKEKQ